MTAPTPITACTMGDHHLCKLIGCPCECHVRAKAKGDQPQDVWYDDQWGVAA